MKKLLTTTLLTASMLVANEVGVNIAGSYTPYSQTNNNGAIILGNTPDQSLVSYELYTVLDPITELCKQKNMKPTLVYSMGSNSDIEHQYILAGLNKYYKNSYAGILLGYGELTWRYNPLNNSKDNDYTATSPIIGLQTGYGYPLTQSLSLNLNIKALYHNYDTYLNPNNTATANIEHDYTLSASVGIGWRF